jgi:hypothetical protein
VYLTRVDYTNQQNVSPDFSYYFGMQPQDVLDQLQGHGGFRTASEEDYVFVESRGGEAVYVELDPSLAAFNFVGVAGSPTRLIMVTGSAQAGSEEALREAFLTILQSVRVLATGEETTTPGAP